MQSKEKHSRKTSAIATTHYKETIRNKIDILQNKKLPKKLQLTQ